MIAGPAPGRSGSPTMAVPVVAKIPAPIVAPTPNAVRCHLPSVRFSPPPCERSDSKSATDFRAKIPFPLPLDTGPPRIQDPGQTKTDTSTAFTTEDTGDTQGIPRVSFVRRP